MSNQGIVVEAVKLAEDGSGDVIVRLYESLGERSEGMVTANFDTKDVQAVDLLERPVAGQGVTPGLDSAKLTLRPFQLVTLRFTAEAQALNRLSGGGPQRPATTHPPNCAQRPPGVERIVPIRDSRQGPLSHIHDSLTF